MRVGVLGSGVVAQTLATGFAKFGHEVMLGTRDPGAERIRAWVSETPAVSAGTFRAAARFGDLLVLAVLGRVVDRVIELAGPENCAGKTVIDTTNPLSDVPPTEGVLQFFTGPNESLGERVQARLGDAHVVKAFNSVGAAQMVQPHYEQGPPTMFICGNSDTAKAQVTGILEQFGWDSCDCGTIRAARAIEPLCILWCIPGFLRNQWTHAFKLLTR